MIDDVTLRDTVREYDRQITSLQHQVQLLTQQVTELRAYNNYLTTFNKALLNNLQNANNKQKS